LADLNFRITFYYFGSKEVVPYLEYRIQTSRDILKWTPESQKKWVIPKVTPSKFMKTTNVKGETEPFKVSGVCTIEVYIKGKPTSFNQWKLVKKIHVNENFLHLKNIEYPLIVEIPVSKLGKAITADKSASNHQSDYYQVQSGDTLETIAKKFKKDVHALMNNNDIKDQNKLRIGQKIYIGDVKKQEKVSIKQSSPNDFVDIQYEVQSGDTLSSLAKKFKVSPALIAMQNNISLSDMNTLQTGTILKVKNNRARYISEIIKKELMFSKEKGLAITQYTAKEPYAKQIFITFSGALYFIGSALDIGIAYDSNGDWMLFVSVGASGEIDPSKVPHLANTGNAKELAELLKDKNKLKESLKKDVSISMGSTTLNVKAKHVSDLTGSGLTLTNTLTVGNYSISRVNGYASVDDVDAHGNKVKRDVRSGGIQDTFDVSAKKIKKVVEGKPVSISHSVAKSYTIPILLYDRNERLMKGQGKGIEYVD
jgi:LysM repeat protein